MPQGKKGISRWILNGAEINAPERWQDAECLATFDRESTQASITIDKFTFVNSEAAAILNHIANGLTGGVGIFEGIPFRIDLYNESNTLVIFNGYIDLTDNVEIREASNKIACKLRLMDEVYSLEEKLRALSFGYLESLGVFSSSDYTDVKYVVQKKINVLETITTSIVIFMMTKELIDTIIKINKDIGLIAADATGGLPLPTAVLAGIILGIVVVLLEVLYAALLLVAIVKMVSNLLSQIIPFKRTAKVLNFRTALTKVCSYLGYGFSSNILDLDAVYYLPSNMVFDETDAKGIVNVWKGNPKGLPGDSDYGYSCVDFFELSAKLFNGKYAIVNGSVCFYNVDDPFWVQQSTYQMPSVLDKVKTYNTDELRANRYMAFETDITDESTIEKYQGTSYEVITNPVVVTNDKLKAISGLDEVRFGVALANRKDAPYAMESILTDLAQIVDGIISALGGIPTYQNMIGNSTGLMIIYTNNWAVPKVIKLNSNSKLVPRTQWSAKYIYETYYIGRSFVASVNGKMFYGQKEVYRNVRIPFGLNDFIVVANNSYFVLPGGEVGKIISCKYRFSSDYAIVDYYIRKTYTENLTETYVEPPLTSGGGI